ncbi:MAG TPA: bifunctional DNA-formamidopyrimidine glycosylase/DNA-(apurinic or apyrimidinic site) lyase [Cellvibrionaceae bacterium]
MPELPEVETTRLGLTPHTLNRKVSAVVVREGRLRWPVPADLDSNLLGQKLLGLSRRGKYLLFEFKTGTLLAHLGMSGSLRMVPTGTSPELHDHVDISFGKLSLRYHDPRRFGCLLWNSGDISKHSLLAHLGPEPLTDDFNGALLFQKSRKRKQSVKTFIMDSRIVVGVGNIYANEALFMTGIKPIRKAGNLTRQNCESLAAKIKFVLARSITQGGTTLRDFVGGDGKPGYFQQQLLVYGRAGEPCRQCQKPLKEVRLAQRSTVYCTACQK